MMFRDNKAVRKLPIVRGLHTSVDASAKEIGKRLARETTKALEQRCEFHVHATVQGSANLIRVQAMV